MKRGAEKQLTKDGHDDGDDDDEIEEIQDPQGFQKADESTLAKRQIRALPKRALTTSRSPSFNGLPLPDAEKVDAAPQPKFGSFVGFGATTAASNQFTFTPQTPPIFGSSPSAFDTAFKPTPSTVSPFSGTSKDPLPSKSVVSPSTQDADAVALKYYKSLRGLNVSFLSAISTAVEKDPFCDVANLVESYKNLRTTIQSEFDGSQSSTVRGPVTTNNLTSLFGAKAPPEKTVSLFSMPTPSVGSGEASPQPPSTSEAGTKTGGFTFPSFAPPSSSALPFGLTSKQNESSTPSSATTPEPPKSVFAFTAPSFTAPSNMESTISKSVPAGSSGQEKEVTSVSSSPRPTSTGPSVGSSAMPSFFSATKTTSMFASPDLTSKTTSVFGSSVFGSSSMAESSKPSPFNPSPAEPDNHDSSKVTSTVFGNATAASSSTSTSIFRSSDKPVNFFGSASQPKTAFVFGKPAGSIGNPVGFGFGSSSPSSGDTTIPGPSDSGFSFVAPSTKPSESLFSSPMTDKSFESTPQPEAEGNEEGGDEEAAKLLHSHTHDEEGEGEEDEETTHVVRCKVYRLFKSGEKNEWKDLGVGMFRLKKHKQTNARRVLMRNSNTGRILINFRMHENLKPSMAKNAISFVGYESNTPVSFSVRVKTEEQAKDLKQALEREIAAVQAAE